METREQASRARGMLVWLRSPGRPVRRRVRREGETTGALALRNLGRGMVILGPAASLMMLLMVADDGASRPSLLELLFVSAFAWFYAFFPAVTGAALYLPLVHGSAKRWPRRGRAIALACTPLVALGTVPWGMWRALAFWQVWLPMAAGLLFWAATLRLPAAPPEPGTA